MTEPDTSTPAETEPEEGGGSVELALAVALTIALVGFFVGVSDPAEPVLSFSEASAASATDGTGLAPTYSELPALRRGPNADWSSDLDSLAPTELLVEGPSTDDDARQAAVATRSERRAFDGAPPTIPHRIDEGEPPNCLVCHERGATVGDRVASIMSHEPLTNCVQCHSPGDAVAGRDFEGGQPLASNSFAGLAIPIRGERIWDGAPPAIPHTTHMRENCVSCHGPAGREPLQTPHMDRQSCNQCHAQSATLDRRPGFLE